MQKPTNHPLKNTSEIFTVGTRPPETRSLLRHLGLAAMLVGVAVGTSGCEGSAERLRAMNTPSDSSEMNGFSSRITQASNYKKVAITCFSGSGGDLLIDFADDIIDTKDGSFQYTSKVTGNEMFVPKNACYVSKKVTP